MKKNEKLWWLMPLAAVLVVWGGVFLASCSGGDDEEEKRPTSPPEEVVEPLGNTFDFNGYEFEVVSGTASKKTNGNIVVETPSEGIAIRLTQAATKALTVSDQTGFYVQAELLPTAFGSGKNKNFGPAGLISDNSSKFSYAGVNYNGRNQLGEISTQSADGKGQQFGSLISDNGYFKDKWTEPYIIRYEYKDGKISGYINGIQFNKSGTTTYELKDNFSDFVSLAGIYTNGDTFEMSSFEIGAVDSGKAAIKISAAGNFVTLSENADKYILLMNPSITVRAGDDAIDYTVKAFADNGTETEFSVASSDDEIVHVEKTEAGFSATPKQRGLAQVTVTAGDVKRVFNYTVDPALSYTDTDYGDTAALLPAVGAQGVFEDEHLEITFDDVPKLLDGGTIAIYEVGVNTPVDTITIGTESNTVGAANYTLKNFMVQVIDKTVFVKLHCSRLENGKKYAVGIPDGVITGTLGGKSFTGFDPRGENPYWTFTVRDAYTPSSTTALKVAKTGDADYRTVQAALDKATDGATITVEKGVYREILNYSGTASMTIVGDTNEKFGADVVIQGINCNSFNGSSDARTAFHWKGKDLTLKNITLQNAYDRNTMGGTAQSEALYFNSTGKLAAYNCSFLGQQDTLLTKGKNWFYQCYIVGDTDFIWGYADVALFEECELYILNTVKGVNGITVGTDGAYIFETRVGAGNTQTPDARIGKGYVLFNSTVKTERDDAYLARRASEIQNSASGDYYDQVAVINTTFSKLNANLWGGPNVKSDKNMPLYIAKDNGTMHVGWKLYGGSGYDAMGIDSKDYFGTITEAVYNAEYSGRNVILNRVYRKDTNSYMTVNERWDISALATEFGASEDKGPALDDGPTNEVYYKFDTATLPNGITNNGFSKHSTSASWSAGSGSTLEFAVTGNCLITVSGFYQGTGTVSVGTQPAVTYDFNNGNTNSSDSTKYLNYSGAGTVKIEAKGTTYITEIFVEYLDAITPVTAITLSQTSAELMAGESLALSTTVTPSKPTFADLVWESSDPAVATVNAGVVKALKAGAATITVRSQDGSNVSASCSLTVTANADAGIAANKSYTYILQGLSLGDSINSEEDVSLSANISGGGFNSSYGYHGAAWTAQVPVMSDSTVIAFVTYTNGANATLELLDGDTSLGVRTVKDKSDTKEANGPIAFVWHYKGSSEKLTLKAGGVDIYVGRIVVDTTPIPSSLTSTVYDFTKEDSFAIPLQGSAGDCKAIWYSTLTGTYKSAQYGLQAAGNVYMVLKVGGACTVTVEVSYDQGTGAITLSDEDGTSVGSANLVSDNGKHSYTVTTSNAGVYTLYMPKDTYVSSISVD